MLDAIDDSAGLTLDLTPVLVEGIPRLMMSMTSAGLSELTMTVATPAAVASSAAMSFVCIPPVPKLEPGVSTLTAILASCTLLTTPNLLALGLLLGFPVYRPSTSVHKKR